MGHAGHRPSKRELWEKLDRLLRVARDAPRRRDRTRAARYAAAVAERLGVIRRPRACQRCQRRRPLTRHHPNHDQPLAVEWLCEDCHGVADGRLPRLVG